MAVVVLDPDLLVYPVVYHRLAVVACLVGVVGVDVVAVSLGILAILVDSTF